MSLPDGRAPASRRKALIVGFVGLALALLLQALFVDGFSAAQRSASPLGVVAGIFAMLGLLGGLLIWSERIDPGAALAALGLAGSFLRGLVLAVLMILPALVGLLIFTKLDRLADDLWFNARAMPGFLLAMTLGAGFMEELAFRGFFFRQLRDGARYSFWIAALVTSALFGLVHVPGRLGMPLWDLLASVGVVICGGYFYCWLYEQWNRNLWLVICLHAVQNLMIWSLLVGGILEGWSWLVVLHAALFLWGWLLTRYRDRLIPWLAS